ncbi:translation initiation factor IF-3 [bacterium]|nr:translation initiation factor IF-3 [bacterium]MBU0900158.1 translation initiation factor IF-3 [bacterium]MBU1154107.1 translation initiation factor IF-3 [bacterium]MBU1782471.1 translation initiation factor IF-3 [bacterium]MBU2599976.1 translation initiation factor IF-3 [bacterium]
MLKEVRVNKKIKAVTVRLISNKGSQVGIVSIEEALRQAEEEGLDLVEIAPQANPVVCKLIDLSKYIYEQKKKARENKKHQKIIHVKEIIMRSTISEHDYQFKFRNLQKFLKAGDKAKVSIRFKGREIGHPELGRRVLEKIIEESVDFATVEQSPVMTGKSMSIVLIPKK